MLAGLRHLKYATVSRFTYHLQTAAKKTHKIALPGRQVKKALATTFPSFSMAARHPFPTTD